METQVMELAVKKGMKSWKHWDCFMNVDNDGNTSYTAIDEKFLDLSLIHLWLIEMHKVAVLLYPIDEWGEWYYQIQNKGMLSTLRVSEDLSYIGTFEAGLYEALNMLPS